MKIAVIGTGTMGSRIVGLCYKAGYTVEAYDPSERAREAAAQAGAKICSSPASAAEDKNFVVLSLPKPEHVLSVLSGNDGIFARIRQDTIIVDTSTVDPSTNERASDKATKASCSYLDAPIRRESGIGSCRSAEKHGRSRPPRRYCERSPNGLFTLDPPDRATRSS